MQAIECAMRLLWDGFTRVYFNAWEEAPKFWSVDQGVGTEELKVDRVHFHGATLSTVALAGKTVQPRAWLEGHAIVAENPDGTLAVTGHGPKPA